MLSRGASMSSGNFCTINENSMWENIVHLLSFNIVAIKCLIVLWKCLNVLLKCLTVLLKSIDLLIS